MHHIESNYQTKTKMHSWTHATNGNLGHRARKESSSTDLSIYM